MIQMNRFVIAMIQQGIPRYAIDLVENSPEWKHKFRTFNESQLLYMIEFYPVFFRTVISPLNRVTTPMEIDEITKQFNSMEF
jgi:O-glycosyl hydrolase